MRPLSDQQRLFLVESDQLYRAWREVEWRHMEYRFGMRWKKVSGKEYLIRLIDGEGRGRSLGPRSEKTESIYLDFQQGRQAAQEKHEGMKARLLLQSRLNRASRLGRMPHVVAEILQGLDRVQALSELRVVGTHALFAYEALAAVEFKMDLLASGDVDLLYDQRQQISILAKKFDGYGLLGLLKKIDKSFEVQSRDRFRAVNKDGFMVDFITQDKGMFMKSPIPMVDGDLEMVEVPNLEWLANSPRLETVVISAKGEPVLMPVPDPRAFLIHKLWLSKQHDREPVKKQRDRDQAIMVDALIKEYLPNYALDQSAMRYFPKRVIDDAILDLQNTIDFDLAEVRADMEAGRFVSESATAHLKRIKKS